MKTNEDIRPHEKKCRKIRMVFHLLVQTSNSAWQRQPWSSEEDGYQFCCQNFTAPMVILIGIINALASLYQLGICANEFIASPPLLVYWIDLCGNFLNIIITIKNPCRFLICLYTNYKMPDLHKCYIPTYILVTHTFTLPFFVVADLVVSTVIDSVASSPPTLVSAKDSWARLGLPLPIRTIKIARLTTMRKPCIFVPWYYKFFWAIRLPTDRN